MLRHLSVLGQSASADKPTVGVPSMGVALGVKVPLGLGHRDQREPQGLNREERAESSGDRSHELTDRNQIRGVIDQGERPYIREALVTKGRFRRFGGCVAKGDVLTWGDLVSA
jgi:hypothetical protein